MYKPQQKRLAAAIALAAMLAGQLQALPRAYADERDHESHSRRTATPIEHLIVVIPENRSYDHTFGTYVPRHGQFASNILSKGIVRADGTPGRNFFAGAQVTVPAQPAFYIGAPAKSPYAVLPAPDTSGTPTAPRDTAPPFTSVAIAAICRLVKGGAVSRGAVGVPEVSGAGSTS